MKSGIVGCVMVADGKTFGRFLVIFGVFSGKVWKIVLSVRVYYFLEFSGGGFEGLTGLCKKHEFVFCLAAHGFQFYDEVGGNGNDVLLAFCEVGG